MSCWHQESGFPRPTRRTVCNAAQERRATAANYRNFHAILNTNGHELARIKGQAFPFERRVLEVNNHSDRSLVIFN